MKKTLFALLALASVATAAIGDPVTITSSLPEVAPAGGKYCGIVFTLTDNARVDFGATVLDQPELQLTSITLQSRTGDTTGIAKGYCMYIVDSSKTLLAVSEAITSAATNGAEATFVFNETASLMTNSAVNNVNEHLTLGETYYAFILNGSRFGNSADRNFNASIGSLVPENDGHPWCDSNEVQLAVYQTGNESTVLQLGVLNGASGNLGTNSNSYMPKVTIEATLAPEPATATLSLLALAGLASRRRRH